MPFDDFPSVRRISAGLALSIVTAMAVATTGARDAFANEADYIVRFEGTWTGSGVVVHNGTPWNVSCEAAGAPGANSLAIRASCHVLLVISVDINVDVTYSPQSDSYRGTYRAGDLTAAISGKRSGDTVQFAMTWAKPIDIQGDTRGRLTIINPGQGDFRLLIDDLKASGPTERTTDVSLNKK